MKQAQARARREQQERLENALEELQKLQERKSGEKAKNEVRVSTSDPQARVMHHSDGGLSLSYNAQISADAAHGLIVGVAVTQEANDSAQLLPAVDRIEQRLEKKPQQIVADGGYTTRDNIEKLAGREIDFLGSMGREEMESGATAPNRLPPSAFLYQPESNCYVCPEGKLLRPQGRYHSKKKRGLVAYCYEAKISDCQACIRKAGVLPGKSQRRPRTHEANRKRCHSYFSEKDGQRRSASAVPPPRAGRGILPCLDQKQTGATAISRARFGQGGNRNSVGLLHL